MEESSGDRELVFGMVSIWDLTDVNHLWPQVRAATEATHHATLILARRSNRLRILAIVILCCGVCEWAVSTLSDALSG